MKARILCRDSSEFPALGPPTLSVIPTYPTSWVYCDILSESTAILVDGHQENQNIAGAVLVGLVIGVLLCAIPFFFLLRKVRRLMKMGRRGGTYSGRHDGGRWKFKEHGPPHGFPEYEAEHLLKHEYEAPLVSFFVNVRTCRG
jgi:hypothetical protein